MPLIDFRHGLGDCVYFAHALPLYLRRGHKIEVGCDPDKACLFEAAGARALSPSSALKTGWIHPPEGAAKVREPWHSNKAAYNLNLPPMPDIGSPGELWDEFCRSRVDLEPLAAGGSRAGAEKVLRGLPRPVVLLHSKGNSAHEKKNLPDGVATDLIRRILDETDGSVIQLDWDGRDVAFQNARVKNLSRDFWRLSVPELYWLTRRADLLIGIDSGPGHFVRFTDTPALVVWDGHHPSDWYLPRPGTLNVVCRHDARNRHRRLDYNVVEVPGGDSRDADKPAWPTAPVGPLLAEQALRLLGERRYLGDAVQDTLLRSLVDRTRFPEYGLAQHADRHRTFDLFLRHLKGCACPRVVETGCVRCEEDFSAGFSTYLFGHFLKHHGGTLTSIDLANGAFARKWCAGMPVEVVDADSRRHLAALSGDYDAAYLDSADLGTPDYQRICLAEAEAVAKLVRPGGLVLIDDSPGKFGKGSMAVPYLVAQGWKVVYHGYQVLLRK